MGRRISIATALTGSNGAWLLPGQLPTFGSGRFAVLFTSGDFVVPAGVHRIRVRLWAGGGGRGANGGSSSFGAFLSATGGTRGQGAVAGSGGAGTGGDFRASGGAGGAGEGGGGGAAGSELGTGGAGGTAQALASGGGGGAVGGRRGGNAGAAGPGHGASPFEAGPDDQAVNSTRIARDLEGAYRNGPAPINPLGLTIPFVGFAFYGAGGQARTNLTQAQNSGGVGAGGAGGPLDGVTPRDGSHGGTFGGGGGGAVSAGSAALGGLGGRFITANAATAMDALSPPPTDVVIAGGHGGAKGRAGSGGGGYARGEIAVSPGQVIAATVAPQDFNTGRSAGLIVVEY